MGDSVNVSADIFRDGHDKLRAVVRYRGPAGGRWKEAEMRPIDAHVDGVRWAGEFPVDTMGRWEYSVQAWTDVFATWRDELSRKVTAGQHNLDGEISEGVQLLEDAARRAKATGDKSVIEHALTTLTDAKAPEEAKHDTALGDELWAAVERNAERHGA